MAARPLSNRNLVWNTFYRPAGLAFLLLLLLTSCQDTKCRCPGTGDGITEFSLNPTESCTNIITAVRNVVLTWQVEWPGETCITIIDDSGRTLFSEFITDLSVSGDRCGTTEYRGSVTIPVARLTTRTSGVIGIIGELRRDYSETEGAAEGDTLQTRQAQLRLRDDCAEPGFVPQ